MTDPITPAAAALVRAVSNPLTKLVESISKGVGGLYEPIGKVRNAKADAEASLIIAAADIQKRELLQQAAQRFAYIETRRQANINAITEEAKANLPDTVNDDPVSEDWMVKFFENCKDVGEKELQNLWARLLVGEVAKPRSFSRRTMETLRTLDPEDAKMFTAVCQISFWQKPDSHFVFLSPSTFSYMKEFTDRDAQNHLISLGLLNAENEPLSWQEDDLRIRYFEEEYVIPHDAFLILRMFKDREHLLHLRHFTSVGNELVRIIPRSPVPGLIEALKTDLSNHQIRFLALPEFEEWKTQRDKK